jgi:hypothetical protein
MKKRIVSLAFAAVMAATQINFVFGEVVTDASINITVNGEAVDFGDVQPVVIDDYTYVPVRPVFEKLGEVTWDEETKAVTLTNGDAELTIYTVQGEAVAGGENFEMEQKPVIIDGRTMLPVREPAGYLGANIGWDEETKTVSLSTDGYIEDNGDSEEALASFIESIKGKPLPEASYIFYEETAFDTLDMDSDDVWNNILLKYADCEGYDELIETMNKVISSYDINSGLSDDEASLLLGEYVAKYFEGLDGLEDKSFMKGLYKEIFVGAQSKVKVDESYTLEQTLESANAFHDGKSDAITCMPELRLTLLISIGMTDYFDNIEEYDENGLQEIGALGYLMLFNAYLYYETSAYPDIFGQLLSYN